jgi:hypothetical protein
MLQTTNASFHALRKENKAPKKSSLESVTRECLTRTALAAAEAALQKSNASIHAIAQSSLSRLPHFSRDSQASVLVLAQNDPVRTLLVDRFVASATRHRGPAQGDPHRAVPQFKVVRVERLLSPRFQEKYLAEVLDIAGLCNRSAAAAAAAEQRLHDAHPG